MAARDAHRELGWVEALSAAALRKFDAEFLAPRPFPRTALPPPPAVAHVRAGAPTRQCRFGRPGTTDGAAEDVDQELYVHVELVPLLHQLAEAVWSLLFATAPDVRSPSLFLAQLPPAQLKRRLEDAQDPGHLEQLLVQALLLDAEAPHLGEEYRTAARRSLCAVQRLLVLATARPEGRPACLQRHRARLRCHEWGALIGFSAEDPRVEPGDVPDVDFGRSAVWLSVLERYQDEASRQRRWVITRNALDELDQEFWLVLPLTQVLDLFWACALAGRNLVDDLHVRFPSDADVDNLVAQPRDLLHKMVFDVLHAGQAGQSR